MVIKAQNEAGTVNLIFASTHWYVHLSCNIVTSNNTSFLAISL